MIWKWHREPGNCQSFCPWGVNALRGKIRASWVCSFVSMFWFKMVGQVLFQSRLKDQFSSLFPALSPQIQTSFCFCFCFFFFSGLNDPEATELVLGLLRIRFILWSIQGLPWKSWETQLKSQRLPQTPRSSGLRRLGIKLPFKYFYSLVPSANKETDWLCLVALWH